ncbi:hypothetical protein DBR32_01680 [Taibaiella sp. KBW10]|uniref:hypothetical protein n=1 Tax=Taibaiella sp. KBW10 TaxID=2153357 RepID=UPI000F5A2A99|nr:hypothetical protein [Taibaiella sp. KBW10]RQO32342.1 hypothetical protein DBR32_01680 [Taibaiella sp. KBW10]
MFVHKKQLLPFGILLAFFLWGYSSSCIKKDSYRTNGGTIAFSKDTFLFDTVFTAMGTSTRSVKIINKEKDRLKIESIRLFRGAQSPYFINVNGMSGKSVSNIDIEGNDSLYIFASVFINPDNTNDPFIVEDRIVARVNGQDFTLPVLAYGQNAIYITDSLLQTQTWTRTKPYVIIKNAAVAPGQTLTINAGTRVYVHADSRLYVQGTLKINGTKTDSVVFQGDRIDRRIYFDEDDFVNGVGGEWGGINLLKTSYNNNINYLLLKNGGASTMLGTNAVADASLQVDPDTVNNSTPKLIMTNSTIRNSGGYGLLAFASSIKSENNLFFASAKENVALIQGGKYDFYGCTMAGFASRINTATEKHYSMVALNFLSTGNNTYIGGNLFLTLRNCIIYGNTEDEFFPNKVDDFTAQVQLDHCLIKGAALPAWVTQQNNLFNQDPLFENTNANDLSSNNYRLKTASPAKAKGISFSGMLPVDMDGNSRANPPSMGCYE